MATYAASAIADTKERFFDIGTIDAIPRLPIEGYQQKDLVSLEEAVKDVEDLLEDIQTKVTIGKAIIALLSPEQRKDLTMDEAAAITLYTMEWEPLERCLYHKLNETLRLKDRRVLKPWFSYLKLLVTALWKLPSECRVVWRGIKKDISCQYVKGNHITWWNLSSTTDAIDVLQSEQFLGKTGFRTLFNIECTNGKQIRDYSYLGQESEILMLPASYFEVLGKIDSGNGLNIIHLREKQPPYQLLKPPFQTAVTASDTPVNKENILLSEDLPVGSVPVSMCSLGPAYFNTLTMSESKSPLKTLIAEPNLELNIAEIAPDMVATFSSDKICFRKDLTYAQLELICYSLQKNTKITYLNLGSVKIGVEEIKLVEQLLTINQTLTDFELVYNDLSDVIIRELTEVLARNQTLRNLRLGNNNITSNKALFIGELIMKNKTLRKLHMPNNFTGDVGAKAISRGLEQNRTLIKLNIDNNQISSVGAKYIGQMLERNTAVQVLVISNNQLGDDGLRELSQALEQNQTLTELDVSQNKITSIGTEWIAEMLIRNITIRTLRISYNQLDDLGASKLASALEINKTLIEIHIDNNKIASAGGKALGKMLTRNATLKRLDMDGNQLGDEGALALINSLAQNNGLMYLNIVNNSLTRNMLQPLESVQKLKTQVFVVFGRARSLLAPPKEENCH